MRKYCVTVINPWTNSHCKNYFWTRKGAERFVARLGWEQMNDNFHMPKDAPMYAVIIFMTGIALFMCATVVWVFW